MVTHVYEYLIAALDGILWTCDRVVVCCSFQHSYQHGALIRRQFVGCRIEVSLCGGLDSERVVTEVNGIGVHRQYGILTVNKLKFNGNNPFLALVYNKSDTRNTAK